MLKVSSKELKVPHGLWQTNVGSFPKNEALTSGDSSGRTSGASVSPMYKGYLTNKLVFATGVPAGDFKSVLKPEVVATTSNQKGLSGGSALSNVLKGSHSTETNASVFELGLRGSTERRHSFASSVESEYSFFIDIEDGPSSLKKQVVTTTSREVKVKGIGRSSKERLQPPKVRQLHHEDELATKNFTPRHTIAANNFSFCTMAEQPQRILSEEDLIFDLEE
jgi:hypothetical protein